MIERELLKLFTIVIVIFSAMKEIKQINICEQIRLARGSHEFSQMELENLYLFVESQRSDRTTLMSVCIPNNND